MKEPMMRIMVFLEYETRTKFRLYCKEHGFKQSTRVRHLIKNDIENSEWAKFSKFKNKIKSVGERK